MKKVIIIFLMSIINMPLYAQVNEPGNNLGKSYSFMKDKFPELRYIKTDEKGNQYEDGYPEDGIATFFYFKNNVVIEECMICEATDGFPLMWFNSMVESFDKQYSLGKKIQYGKEYVFSTFKVTIIYVSENGTNTALIVYEKLNNSSSQVSERTTSSNSSTKATPRLSVKEGKLEWYEIEYTENKEIVKGMTPVGQFSATSSPSIFGARSYSDAYYSAIKKLQKKAAKKGARLLLVTYRSGMNTDFLTVKVEAIGYK